MADNKGGRPRLPDPRRCSITIALSSKEYQRLLALAKRDEKPLSAAVRDRALRRFATD